MRARLVIVLLLLVLIPTAILSILASKSVQSRELVLRERLRVAAAEGIASVSSHLREEVERIHARVVGELAAARERRDSVAALLRAGVRCRRLSALVGDVYAVALPGTLVYPAWPADDGPAASDREGVGQSALFLARRLQPVEAAPEGRETFRRVYGDEDRSLPIRYEAGLALARSYRASGQAGEEERVLAEISAGVADEKTEPARDDEGFVYALEAGRLLAERRRERGDAEAGAEAALDLLDRLVELYAYADPLQRGALAAYLRQELRARLAAVSHKSRRRELTARCERAQELLVEQEASEAFVLRNADALLGRVRAWAASGEARACDWLIAGQSLYSVGSMPGSPGLVAGFRIGADALREAARTAAGAVALPHGLRLDLLGDGTNVDARNRLVAGRLAAPFDFLSFAAVRMADEEFARAQRLRRQLYTWGIVLLAVGILLGTLSVLRQALIERREAHIRGNFAAAVSHELRTPLSSMKMLTESLFLGHVKSREKRQRFLETIVRECDRLSVLIERILYFVRMEHGAPACNLEQQDVGELVTTAVNTFLERRHDDGVEVETDIAPRLPSVPLDWDAVTELLLNLLENAAKYSYEQKHLRVSAQRRDGELWISVADRGVGIERHHLKKIFRQFYRVQDSRIGSPPGIGLGLAFCKHIAEAHGGRMQVQSTPGQGSTFSFVMPLGAQS